MCIRDRHETLLSDSAHNDMIVSTAVAMRKKCRTTGGFVPVSYTHLDVYKRQPEWGIVGDAHGGSWHRQVSLLSARILPIN